MQWITALLGSLFRFRMRCSSLRATTHLVFSLSVSASIRRWLRSPGGSIIDVLTYHHQPFNQYQDHSGTNKSKGGKQSRKILTRKMQGMSFLLAWMTSESLTELTSNWSSLISSTFINHESYHFELHFIPSSRANWAKQLFNYVIVTAR